MKLAITNNAKILAIFAVACTALVALVNLLTKDRIAEQQQKYLLTTLHQVISEERLNNDLYQDCQLVTNEELLGSAEPQKLYIARQDNIPVAIAVTAVAPGGYNGKINLLIAINSDETISGVRVLKHNETPGLGDKIETRKDDWILSFNGKSTTGETDLRWQVKKDGGNFDQFTGATITPRAVVKAVHKSMLYYQQNKQSILESAVPCRGDDENL